MDRKRFVPMKRFFFITALVILLFGNANQAEAKNVKASVPKSSVSVGERVAVKSATADVTYKSSNTSIAYVHRDGVITGKKPGIAVITVSKKGYKKKTFNITIKESPKKPVLPIVIDEVEMKKQEITQKEDGSHIFSAVIKNNAAKSTLKKIEYSYQINEEIEVPDNLDEEGNPIKTIQSKTVTLTAKSVKAGKTSARVSCEGDYSGSLDSMKLKEIHLYAGEALYIYHVQTNSYTLKWGTSDKTAPVIRGWVKSKSAYNGCALRVCYSDKKSTYHFKEHVTATDARDGKTKVSVDTSEINWNKTGVYRIYYTSKDSAGNIAKSWAKVQVYAAGEPEKIADLILSSITKSSWSDEKKLRKIYTYVKGHCSYTGDGSHSNWRMAALKGIKSGNGDCFTFYAMSRLLITRAGISNIMVRRYPSRKGYDHWWNLVYVKGGWYHFDTTPRRRGGKFCLVTDAQLRLYSSGSTFRFKESLYPKRATKKISPNP